MKLYQKIALSAVVLSLFVLGGCLVSGTFVVEETFSFTTQTGFYFEPVNLTTNPDWEDHVDNLDDIELIGFELWITNNETSEWTYSAYADEYDELCDDLACFNESTTKFKVFGDLVVPAATSTGSSTKYVAYNKSFQFIQNFEAFKKLAMGGKFNLYGIASGGSGGNGGKVDSIKVIITINASDT